MTSIWGVKWVSEAFPVCFFIDSADNRLMLYGVRPYEQFERNIAILVPGAKKNTYEKTPQALFDHFPTMTTKEFAVLSETSSNQASLVLNAYLRQGKIIKLDTKNGPMWIAQSNF
jgi:putative protein-disulfide isomerase